MEPQLPNPHERYHEQPKPLQSVPEHSPYDFIRDAGAIQQKQPLLAPNSIKTRVLVVVVIAVVLIIIFSVVAAIMSGPGRATNSTLQGIAASQQEIIRVSDLGLKGSKSADLRGFVLNAKLSVMTQQQDTSKILQGRGLKAGAISKTDTKTDKKLQEATQANNFDKVLDEEIRRLLNNYYQVLKSAYESGTVDAHKPTIQDHAKVINTLLNEPVAAQ